jgi:hypothetical protein
MDRTAEPSHLKPFTLRLSKQICINSATALSPESSQSPNVHKIDNLSIKAWAFNIHYIRTEFKGDAINATIER